MLSSMSDHRYRFHAHGGKRDGFFDTQDLCTVADRHGSAGRMRQPGRRECRHATARARACSFGGTGTCHASAGSKPERSPTAACLSAEFTGPGFDDALTIPHGLAIPWTYGKVRPCVKRVPHSRSIAVGGHVFIKTATPR